MLQAHISTLSRTHLLTLDTCLQTPKAENVEMCMRQEYLRTHEYRSNLRMQILIISLGPK